MIVVLMLGSSSQIDKVPRGYFEHTHSNLLEAREQHRPKLAKLLLDLTDTKGSY